MSTLRRPALAGIGVAASLVLAGCAGNSGSADSEAGSQKTSQSPAPQASGGRGIVNPKDPAAADVCSLLPADAAASLGVKPEGTKESNTLKPSLPDRCEWENADGSKSVSLTALPARSIEVYYNNSDGYGYFKKMTVSGYPAVNAQAKDPKKSGSCDIFLATKKNQVVYASARTPDVGKIDPCAISKKMLKLSVSSWPAAK